MVHQPQGWDQREDARVAFREAGRELNWTADHYRQARYAIEAGNGSPKELSRARQAWGWALAQWVQALTYREEAMDGVALDAGVGEDLPQDGQPSSASAVFQESRQEAEARYRDYERVRRSASSPAEVVAARNAWGEALTRWSRALISREMVRDNYRLATRDERTLLGAGLAGDGPGAFGPGTSPRVQEIVEESRRPRPGRWCLRRPPVIGDYWEAIASIVTLALFVLFLESGESVFLRHSARTSSPI
ncbi:hypothetical protein [Streptosporangium canum]|uniref:hypothetical protein n=1 Tax=Streptosporangium canum TaxID=324952 RepID=UPI003790CFE9